MAKIDGTLEEYLTDVADAIREKTGITTKISAANFDTAILSISGGSNYVFAGSRTDVYPQSYAEFNVTQPVYAMSQGGVSAPDKNAKFVNWWVVVENGTRKNSAGTGIETWGAARLKTTPVWDSSMNLWKGELSVDLLGSSDHLYITTIMVFKVD